MLRIDPKYSKAHYNLGDILLSQGKMKKAVTHYAKTIEFRPDDVQTYNKIGIVLFKQGKLKKAGVFFSKAVQIKPSYTEAQKNIALLKKTLTSSKK